MKFAYKKYKNL